MKVIDNIRDWFQIFRVQTAADVFMFVLISFLAAGDELLSCYLSFIERLFVIVKKEEKLVKKKLKKRKKFRFLEYFP